MVGICNRYRKIVLCLALCLLVILPIANVYAEKTLVIDNAGLMTEDEVTDLNQKANALSEEYNMDIVIVTADHLEGKTTREFADDYFDYNDFGRGASYDGILFLIDMENRIPYISTTGVAIRYFTDQRLDAILDLAYDSGLPEGDYYGAALGFLEGSENYLQKGISSDQYNEPEHIPKENKLTSTDIIIGLLGGLGVGGVFVLSTISQYRFKKRPNPYSYRSNSAVNFHRNEDRLINSFTTHRVIPKPQPTNTSRSTSGRSTTHRSSSGRTHGGRSGRKF
ncbi:MAG: TPM domain-containing protein [Tissierella sp.]|nr:TPM domain-containing protein [Tissierella sp.]